MSESSGPKTLQDWLALDPEAYELLSRAGLKDGEARAFVKGAVNIDAIKKIARYVTMTNPRDLGFLRRATGGEEQLRLAEATDFDLRHLGLFLALVITMRDVIQADSSGSDEPKRDREPSDFIPSDFLGSNND